jgi:hypothetical protein
MESAYSQMPQSFQEAKTELAHIKGRQIIGASLPLAERRCYRHTIMYWLTPLEKEAFSGAG